MSKKLIIIGAGGHGRVVADAFLLQKEFGLIGFADADAPIGKAVIGNFRVIAGTDDIEKLKSLADYFIVAIGNNEARKKIFLELSSVMKPASVIHPFASCSPFSKTGEGVMILSGAVVNANAVIGNNCIINSQSLVDHDTLIGDHSHISQGAIVGSHNKVPENFTLGFAKQIESNSKFF